MWGRLPKPVQMSSLATAFTTITKRLIVATKNGSSTHVERGTLSQSLLTECDRHRRRGNTKWVDTAKGEEDEPAVATLAVGEQQSPPLTVNVELNGDKLP